jgi:formamidopyrimidine-DNA glycosylase
MPELPEVETVRRGLAPVMEGATFARVDLRRGDLRAPFPRRFAARLAGRTVASLRRRGKFLLADLDDGNVLVMHLGMSGSFRIESDTAGTATTGTFYHPRGKLRAHDHVVFHLSSGVRLVFNDPRRFGMMDLVARNAIEGTSPFDAIGVEPLSPDFCGAALASRFAGRRAPVKTLLMDQRLIAGVGNIYACEALWRARISPNRPGRRFATKAGRPTPSAERLASALREVLEAAIAAGGASLRDHIRATGELGEYQHAFAVYDREGQRCPRNDGGTVRRTVQAGRSTFYCPACQR